jgi:mycothiol synthase
VVARKVAGPGADVRIDAIPRIWVLHINLRRMPDEVVEFVAAEATPEQWARWHRLRKRWHDASWHDEPYLPDPLEEAELTRPDPFGIHLRFVRVRGHDYVTALTLHAASPESPEYESSRHIVYVNSFVLPERRRQRLAAGWLPVLVERMDGIGATVATMATHEEPGHAFLRWLGADSKYVERQNRLDLRTLDWALVERWAREGQERSPEAQLELYPRRIPEEKLDEIARANTRLLNTMPFEAMDHGDIVFTPEMYHEWSARMDVNGSEHHTILVREPDASISALTDVMKRPHEQGYVRQMFTGVDPAARGRGLGKWIKAAMLLRVRETHPETVYVTTENAGSNAAMLAINQRLGFGLFRESTTYQIGRQELVRRARPA